MAPVSNAYTRGRRLRHRFARNPVGVPHIHIAGGPWISPTFADSTGGDRTDGDDPMVRYAASTALGPYNGAVVVVDPDTGRVLTMVNQKLALTGAFQPCSTIKLVTGFAGLGEDVIHNDTLMRTGKRQQMTLTHAFEHSSNRYFASVGRDLGFDRFLRYARMFGLGETAGLNIPDETPGILPDAPPSDAEGGMSMMASFGLDIGITPIELAAVISTIANDGTLYYLQYPRTRDELVHFAPKVKRHLEITAYSPAVKQGLFAVVAVGTGRRANDGPDDPIYGKTGTCTDARYSTHLGWFASYNHGLRRSIAVVVLLTGGQPVNGALASSVAGSIYRTLQQDDYFGAKPEDVNRASLR